MGLLPLAEQLQQALARHRLNPAHTGRHRAFTDDLEGAGLGRIVQVGAAAEFDGKIAGLDHPDDVAVFFIEQVHGAQFLRLINGHLLHLNRQSGEDGVVDDILHLPHLLFGHGAEVDKVKAQRIRLHQRARLLHMIAQHHLQRLLQQMGEVWARRMAWRRGRVHLGGDPCVLLQHAGDHMAGVDELAIRRLLRVAHLDDAAILGGQHARVAHLAAAFTVKGRLLQDDQHILPGARRRRTPGRRR